MHRVPLQIEALAPLAFPERKPGVQFNASLPYIPGAAIYGALGAWLYQQGQFDEQRLRALRCHNAYPALEGDHWVRPLPATAMQPKGIDDDHARLYDSLYARVCWEMQEPAALIYAPTDAEGRPWEAVGAKFYSLNGTSRYRSVQQRVLTRVAINRHRGTAEEGRLYSPLAISEVTNQAPTRFCGSLVAPTASCTELIAALQNITHLGGRQTSGLGAVKIAIAEEGAVPCEDWESIQRRVVSMTKRFQQQAQLYTTLGGTPWLPVDETIFTLNLLSDTILLEQGWLPTQQCSPHLLKAVTGIEADLLRAFTTTRTVGGWQVTWQRHKPTDLAVAMGGLFVFQARHPLQQGDYERLAELQQHGIGERRSEGFGQIRVCDEFHLFEGEQ